MRTQGPDLNGWSVSEIPQWTTFVVTITQMKHAPDGTTSGVAIGGAGGRGSCPPVGFCYDQSEIYKSVILQLVKTSRLYCSKRRDHNGSFQSQHFLHGCTRKFTSNSYFLLLVLCTPCKASNII